MPAFWLMALHVVAQPEPEVIKSLKAKLDTAQQPLQQVGLLNDIAWEYSLNRYDSSLFYTQRALALARQLNNTYWIATSTEMMAMLHEIKGDTEKAITLYLQVIKLREQLGGQGLETTFNNLGVLFNSQDNYEKALEYYYKSYQIELNRNNNEGIAGSLINMSVALSHLNKRDSSFVLMQQAKAIAKQHGFAYLLHNVYLDFSSYYLVKNNPDSALYYCNQLLDNQAANPLKNEVKIIALQNTADSYLMKNQPAKALSYCNKVEQMAIQLNSLEYYNRLYLSKAKALAALGQHKQAYAYMLKYAATSDSLINTQTLTILHNLETKYQTEKKEREIAQLQLATSRSLNQRNLFIVLVVGGGIGLIFLFYLFRVKSKAHALISQSLAEKEVLLKEIHHRVKNNLQIISSLLNLQSRYVADQEAIQAINEGKSRVKAMSLIHQKLYQKDNLTGIEMPGYIAQLVESLFEMYGFDREQVSFKSEIENLRLDIDTAIPLGLILNEWVTNALKYAFDTKQGVLYFRLFRQSDVLIAEVKDNGSGCKPTTPESTGYGKRLVASLARKLDAEVSYAYEQGTTCTITMKKFKLV